MRLRVQRFGGRLQRDVVEPFAAAQAASQKSRRDPRARSWREATELVVVGPFPVYTASVEVLLRSRKLGRSARRRGWRALILSEGDAIATVDTSGVASRRASGVRGPEPARALRAAVLHAHAFARARGLDPRRHELRLLEISEAYLTAVWIPGAKGFLVPTRAGGSRNAIPSAHEPDALIRSVERVYRQRSRNARRRSSTKRTIARGEERGR